MYKLNIQAVYIGFPFGKASNFASAFGASRSPPNGGPPSWVPAALEPNWRLLRPI
jgi:hypothetical protein